MQTPVLPEATILGALSAQLRRPRSRSATAGLRRSAPFDRSRRTSAQSQTEERAGLVLVGRNELAALDQARFQAVHLGGYVTLAPL